MADVVLTCATEFNTAAEIESFAAALKEAVK
jgi:hypothetical protein